MTRKYIQFTLALSLAAMIGSFSPSAVFAAEDDSSTQTRTVTSDSNDEDDNLSPSSTTASSGSTQSTASGSSSSASTSAAASAFAGNTSSGSSTKTSSDDSVSSSSAASFSGTGFYASSKEAGKMKCSAGTNIQTGQQVTVKLNKKAASHDWTWTFSGTAGNDVHIISQDAASRQIRFTVWPSEGDMVMTGTDPSGLTISYGFNVTSTGKWKNRENFRTQALKGVTSGMSEEEMVIYFANYICDRASYGPGQGNFFRVIDEGVGDCWCYSTAFRLLADAVGIETIIVKNGGSKSHYWNQVQIDGVWYNVDVQGFDTSRTRKWILCSDERHGWHGHTSAYEKHSIYYPIEPAHECTESIDF